MSNRAGIKNKTTIARNRLIENLEPLLIEKLFDLLESGDTSTILHASKILYGEKGFPRKPLGLPRVVDVESCKRALSELADLVNEGKCSSADAARIANLYSKFLETTEIQEILKRIEKLEEESK